MTHTSIAMPEDKAERFAQGHTRGRSVSNWDFPTLAGAGALRSTVEDILKFLALLDDGELRLARAARMTHEPRARKRVLTAGLGWFIVPVERGKPFKAIWHDAGTGGFRSVPGFVKETNTAVVVLSNSSRPVDSIGLKIVCKVISDGA